MFEKNGKMNVLERLDGGSQFFQLPGNVCNEPFEIPERTIIPDGILQLSGALAQRHGRKVAGCALELVRQCSQCGDILFVVKSPCIVFDAIVQFDKPSDKMNQGFQIAKSTHRLVHIDDAQKG